MADVPVWYVTGKNYYNTHDMSAAGIYCKLLDSTYNPTTHYADTTLTVAGIAHEAAAGVALTGINAQAWGQEVEAEIFCDNITFLNVTGTVGFVLFYVGTVPLCLLILSNPVTYAGDTVQLLANEGGLFALN